MIDHAKLPQLIRNNIQNSRSRTHRKSARIKEGKFSPHLKTLHFQFFRWMTSSLSPSITTRTYYVQKVDIMNELSTQSPRGYSVPHTSVLMMMMFSNFLLQCRRLFATLTRVVVTVAMLMLLLLHEELHQTKHLQLASLQSESPGWHCNFPRHHFQLLVLPFLPLLR